MSYLDAILLNQILSYEPVSSRGSTGYQDKTYGTAQSISCREEAISENVIDSTGVMVLATSLVFIDADIWDTPDFYARYILPSGEIVRLAKAEAINKISDTQIAGGTRDYDALVEGDVDFLSSYVAWDFLEGSYINNIAHWEAYFTKA